MFAVPVRGVFSGRLPFWAVLSFLSALSLLCLLTLPAAASDPLADRTRAEIKAIQSDLVGQENDFDELLGLRERIEPLRDALRNDVGTIVKKRDEAKARLSEIGPELSYGAPPEAAAVATERKELQKNFAAIDADFKQAQLALTDAERLWTHLTSLRSDAFADQIFRRTFSPLTLEFWTRLVSHGLPATFERTQKAYAGEAERVVNDGVAESAAILAGIFGGLVIVFVGFHAWLVRRAKANVGPVPDHFERRTAIRNAFFVLVMRALPAPIAFWMFTFGVVYFDLSSDNLDLLLERSWVVVLVVSLSRGIMAALLAPRKPFLRLVKCSNRTARAIYRAVIFATNVFVAGIFLTTFEDIISAPTSVILATSVFVALGVAVCFIQAFVRVRDRPAKDGAGVPDAVPDAETQQERVVLNLGWLRPLVVLILLFDAAAVASGYVTLAGFVMARVTMVVLAVAFAILLSLFIEEAFGNILTSKTATGRGFAHAIGLRAEVLDLITTTIAGLLRLAIVCVTLVFAFGPWGFRFGDINPFNGDLFAFSFAYIKVSVGTVSFALLIFVVGLLGTRLITGWLDSKLLPLTNLDPGLQNSMTTVLGYAGFAATVIMALSQLGINPQNLTVVAGALSVGIGFGLQGITSNFISSLIVLAERPIRVGDFVAVKGEEGRVKKISVRSTTIGGSDSTDIIVPNTDILTSVVRNKSLGGRDIQLTLPLVVTAEADEEKVMGIMTAAAVAHADVRQDDPAPGAFFTAITDLGLKFELRCIVEDLEFMARIRSDILSEIVKKFRETGIQLAMGPLQHESNAAKPVAAATPVVPAAAGI